MLCPRCNAVNNDTAEFCHNCGCALLNNTVYGEYYSPLSDSIRNCSEQQHTGMTVDTADRFAVMSFIFAISSFVSSVIFVIFVSLSSIFMYNNIFFFDVLTGFLPLAAFSFFVCSLVFSFIATAKNTRKRKLAVAARIIVFSEIGVSVLLFIGFILFLFLAAVNGPYY